VRLDVERMEDRLVPGETLSGLLQLPVGLLAIPDLVSPQGAACDGPLDLTIADEAAAAQPSAFFLPTEDTADLSGASSLVVDYQREIPAPALQTQAASASPIDTVFGAGEPSPAGSGLDASLVAPFAEAARTQHPAGAPLSSPGPAVGDAGLVSFSPPGTALNAPAVQPVGAPVSTGTTAPLAGDAGAAEPMLHVRPMRGPHGGGGGGTPAGYSPAQIRHAYGFDHLTQNGTGQTIAIVDAYDDPNISSDLNTFSTQFGLPTTTSGAFTFTKAYAQGSKPSGNAGWGQEISLDVEWAHAIAPNANILLVETASNSFSNLFGGVDYAVSHGAHIVSMSWGANDFSGESSYDSHFNVAGVTFLASSGDSGGVVNYPAASPYVVSVGGTHLPLDSSGNLTGSETVWSSGGGGASLYEAEPGYQTSYGISLGGRGTPDVSYNADPYTGVAVYDSYGSGGQSGWLVFGGTSAGAPQWAGLIALVNQGRATPLSSSSLTTSPEYTAATGAVYASNYRDVTSGSNGYPAGPGYDLATGVGSPLANNLVPYLTSL
jgi:subtilase family serine protease